MSTRTQNRRDTAANWTANNPTLSDGEIGFETDTGLFKIGANNTAWTSLAYAQVAGPTGLTGEVGLKGDPGDNGAPGDNGLSAYEIWLNLGNSGSEQDFIDSLAGEDGVAGENGSAGAPGMDGLDGVDGVDGTFATAQTISSDITADTYTLSTSDAGKLLVFSRATQIMITIPTHADDPIPVGTRIDILQKGIGQVLVHPIPTPVSILSSSGTYTRVQYSGATLIKITTNSWSLVGDLTDNA
jgi:hypothetical protein